MSAEGVVPWQKAVVKHGTLQWVCSVRSVRDATVVRCTSSAFSFWLDVRLYSAAYSARTKSHGTGKDRRPSPGAGG